MHTNMSKVTIGRNSVVMLKIIVVKSRIMLIIIMLLNSIFDTYTRIINTRLNAMLHTTCEVEVESIE